jgi:hypothetical protein
VAPRIEAEAHEGVARLQKREEHSLIRLGAGVRLHIGERAVEQPLGAVDGEFFDHIDIFAAAVIAPSRIALGIFVGENRSLRLQDRLRDDVFGGDQLDLVLLALEFVGDGVGNLGVGLGQPAGEKGRILRSHRVRYRRHLTPRFTLSPIRGRPARRPRVLSATAYQI